MSGSAPPVWTSDQFDQARLASIAIFRERRMAEPLEEYMEAFDGYRAAMENLLEITVDLSQIIETAVTVLTDPDLLDVVRYLSGPPISQDDLKTLVDDASLAPSKLRDDPSLARKVVETVLLGLDRNRFPWVPEDREPTEPEREAAAMASAALLASRRVMTDRANIAKLEQEEAVRQALLAQGFHEMTPRVINTPTDFPKAGEFCRETMFGSRKADLAIGLWDNRVMPTECKVSNSSTNSVKRLNNDAAVKAVRWREEFGTFGVVPAAVVAGVFKRRNLEQAQAAGLTIFWAHDLTPMVQFIDSTRPS